MLQADTLKQLQKIRHGFFTRKGGVSKGIYQSLNCGLGSKDDRAFVLQNRGYVAGMMNVPFNRLVSPYQAHTVDCATIDEAFMQNPQRDELRCDALVTKTKNIAIAISTADCTPILLADAEAGVIGAVHAGWRGAVGGILGVAVSKMISLGAHPQNIVAAIGPVIRQPSYEVGQDVFNECTARGENRARFFEEFGMAGKYLFDLPGLVAAELQAAGVTAVEDLQHDTYTQEDLFFSYRRMTHRNEPDYGRHLHAICLES